MANQLGSGNWIHPPQSTMDLMTVEEKYILRDILQRKIQNIPAGLLPPFQPPLSTSTSSKTRKSTEKEDPERYFSTADVVNHTSKAVNLPHIPPDLRLEFLFKNRATIDAHSRLAIKDAEKQHIDITRGIFFWRLDDLHQFQRYHDSARWNIAIFIALLTDKNCNNPRSTKAEAARGFLVAYLAAVLEHHNDAAVFDKREVFVQLWKNSEYDLFTFNSAQKQIVKKEMKRLNKEWQEELERIQQGQDLGNNTHEVETIYNAKVTKFVGILVPGSQSQRGPTHRAPTETIEVLKQQSNISANSLQKHTLLEALKTNTSDYYVPKPTPNTKRKVNTEPPEVPNHEIFGFAQPSADFLEAQKPKPEPPVTDWPALHFPKISQLDPKKDPVDIVNKREAIWVLKRSKPNAMLAKLMELFPEAVPVRAPPTAVATPSPLEALPSTNSSSASVAPATFEDLGAFVASSVLNRTMGDAAFSNLGTNTSPVSQDNQQMKLGKRSSGERDVDLEEPENKRRKEEQVSFARSLMLPVDDSLLQVQTTWQISADTPAPASTPSLFGSNEQKLRSPLLKGSD